MKNIYNITKGQLITLWVFGALGWLYLTDDYGSGLLLFFIPFVLIFYTIGWRNYRKTNH